MSYGYKEAEVLHKKMYTRFHENKHIVERFIQIFFCGEVVSVDHRSTQTRTTGRPNKEPLYSMEFCAAIKTKDGDVRRITVEMGEDESMIDILHKGVPITEIAKQFNVPIDIVTKISADESARLDATIAKANAELDELKARCGLEN